MGSAEDFMEESVLKKHIKYELYIEAKTDQSSYIKRWTGGWIMILNAIVNYEYVYSCVNFGEVPSEMDLFFCR